MDRKIGRHLPWNDDELIASVDTYLYMLQLELSKIPFSAPKYANFLLSGPLYRRGKVSVRYRMRNISFVMQERGMPTISAYSPASQVGSNVKKKLHRILDSRAEILASIVDIAKNHQSVIILSDVQDQLQELKHRVTEIEGLREVGIGHNNPPEAIDLFAEDLSEIVERITDIEKAVSERQADKRRIRNLSESVTTFGLTVTVWLGQRLTEFARAAAATLGSVLVLRAFEMQEKIIEIFRLLFSFLG